MLRKRLGIEVLEDRTVPTTTVPQFVTSLYSTFLHRPPTSAELASSVNLLNGGASRATVASNLLHSAAFFDAETRSDYQTFLGRSPSSTELANWRAALQGGLSVQQQMANFMASDEFYIKNGATAQGWINGAYKALLNRAPDSAGENAFLSMGLQSPAARMTAANSLAFSAEEDSNLVNQAFRQILNQTPSSTILNNWTNALRAGVPLAQLDSTLAASGTFFGRAGTTSSTTAGTIHATAGATQLLTLVLPPLDIKLLGLEVQTIGTIKVTVSALPGQGKLLGNLLSDVSNLLNLKSVNNALNNVLSNVVHLVNSVNLNIGGIKTGDLTNATAAVTPVLDLFVAPVHLDLLGALVDTTPIQLKITAHSGQGLLLGNVVAALANLFNPPLPSKLNLDVVNQKLTQLLSDLNSLLPSSIATSPVSVPKLPAGTERIVSLSLAPINLNLLGLILKTSQIQVNADAITGKGDLLGNVLTTLLNTLGATPQNLTTLSNNLNGLLGKVIGVLNAANLILPSGVVSSLSHVLQQLALPNLINSTGTATAPILDLIIASQNNSPPVDVNLLGLHVTTSNIHAQLLAQTGDGQILGNLLYNVANLLNPGGALGLLSILGQLGV